ncbi:ATP-binding cassette domain-containing protein [Azospirillum oryzae]|uniref:ATP-binding cassette domain-containing protein n=1 Tax=Azospirillum oryzae TaxID=286727 RepID=A0A6N1AZM7_9PROT|nr:ABC transporter transmembrane domain-containing protein [Azospirillum oryzae]QKS53142.1 ATP-binding cassette domain-containing protein [Azospirillum oryzae]GLR80564.1 ABC transporter ATP-binding protein/permease [Azospirillum oryzae]
MIAASARGEADTRRRDLGPLRRLVPFLLPYKWRILGAMMALTVAAGTVLGLGQGMRVLIDQGFAGGDTSLLDRALLVLLGVIALMAASTYGRFYLVSWIGERVVADIRRAVYDHVLTLSPGFFETTKTGEILSRLTTDTTLLQVVVGSSASIALRNTLLFLGGTGMLLITSPKLTGLVALVVPLVVAPIIFFGRRVRKLSRDSQDRIADIGSFVEETLAAIRTVQAFTHEAIDRTLFGKRVEEAFDVAIRRVRVRAVMTVIVIVLVFGAVGIILWIGGHDVVAGRITPGELSAFVIYSVVVAGSVGAISEVIGDLQRAAGATERLFSLLSVESEIRAPAVPKPLPIPAAGALTFDAVRFHYPSRPDWAALEGFSLAVKPGERVALVGPSGAGKSTVFQLLLRYYDPQAGSVRLDGVELRDADPVEVRRRLGLVAQDPVVFSANAWENIRYGRPDASDTEVRAAAEAAHALDFLDALPEGFDTFLGEKGVRLSGGQRQRLAIARAILRDPPVLLLDEATSALDAESERMVQDALDRLMHGRTTLIVAHRLATVLNADRIVVMDQGRVVETGTHGELVAQGGLYARLAALQFDRADGVA